MRSPAEDIKDLLDADSTLGLTFATDLFIEELPDSPSTFGQVVLVTDTGGFEPQANYVYEMPTIQILVRGDKGKYLLAHALATAIKDFLHGKQNDEVGGARYIGMWASSDIISLGRDANHRPLLSVNFRLHRTDA